MPGEKAALQENINDVMQQLAELEGGGGGGGGGGGAPPVAGARKASDGNYYVPDPKRPGKYLQVS
jgi:hypothetical protein